MSMDNSMVAAIVGRMANPEVNLAAHGSIVYPISLMIEAPIICMLSVSLALCTNRRNYQRLLNYCITICAALTVAHLLVAFTPLFHVVVEGMIGAPKETLLYAQRGLRLMLPWTAAIGMRRFYQGIMIYQGRSKLVTIGTFLRMISMGTTLMIGYSFRSVLYGADVAAIALCVGVVVEGTFAVYFGRKCARLYLPSPEDTVISWKELALFVFPLILTQILSFAWMSIGSAAMSRMPNPIVSLAVWPVVSGLVNILRSFGMACNETALSLLRYKDSYKKLLTFTWYVIGASMVLYGLFAFTPIGNIWFETISALSHDLAAVARITILIGFSIPISSGLLYFYQACLLYVKKTRGFLEALVIFLVVIFAVMGIGIAWQKFDGVYVVMWGMTAALLAQMVWTWIRTKPYAAQLAGESA